MVAARLLLLGSVLLAVGCKPSKPSGVLSESKMAAVLVDFHLAQGMAGGTERGSSEELRYAYTQAVFRKHRITEAEFDSSMIYYCEHAEDLSRIYAVVGRRIEANAALMGVEAHQETQYHELSADGDTANIWPGRKAVVLRPNRLDNIYSFSLPADTSFHVGDSFMWRMSPLYVSQAGRADAFVQLVVSYVDGSTASSNQMLYGGRDVQEVRVDPRDGQDTLDIRGVEGFVYLPLVLGNGGEEGGYRMLMLRDIALVRFHKKNSRQVAVVADSLQADTLDIDTVDDNMDMPSRRRLSPTEMRDAQPRERRIDVVKERPVNPNLRPARRTAPPHRNRR